MSDEQELNTQKTLIVNYLPDTLIENEVKAMFEKLGPVSRCKLVLNTTTGRSAGYAFVDYVDEVSAVCAISQVNGMKLQGKILRVHYATQRNGKLYIAGLPTWVAEDELFSLFLPFGYILSHNLLRNPDGTSRGIGFVEFSLDTEASIAIEQMAGKTLPDATVPLIVQVAASKQDLASVTTNISDTSDVKFNPMGKIPPAPIIHPVSYVAAALEQYAKGVIPEASVYVYGLEATHTELTLYELFSKFGGILNVKLIRDLKKKGTPCKGYGFVNFNKSEDAAQAVKEMNGTQFEKKVLQVSIKENKSPDV